MTVQLQTRLRTVQYSSSLSVLYEAQYTSRSTTDNAGRAINTTHRYRKGLNGSSKNYLGNASYGGTRDPFAAEIQSPTRECQPMLRFDWGSLDVMSPLARQMADHQSDCSLPQADFRFRNRYGLGSDLHVWTQALCNGMDRRLRVRTEAPWIYVDHSACNSTLDPRRAVSSMTCYFPASELVCPNDDNLEYALTQQRLLRYLNQSTPAESSSIRPKLYRRQGVVSRSCGRIMGGTNYTYSDIRAAGVEFLFTGISSIVVEEADQQLRRVFPPDGVVPRDLITVHVRWGDKQREMELVPIVTYVEAVETLLRERRNQRLPSEDDGANIFLATEDPRAVQEFVEQMSRSGKRNWIVYVDDYHRQFEASRNPDYNGNPRMTRELHGRPGLVALASLLVAMEANDFVLTTASNWSRLMNELRKSVLDPRCDNCTRMIDLRQGEW